MQFFDIKHLGFWIANKISIRPCLDRVIWSCGFGFGGVKSKSACLATFLSEHLNFPKILSKISDRRN
jgi:hypothetical protein